MQQSSSTYRIIISGGGTGGHIYPAIAIANAFKVMNPDNEILFVGANDRMEMQKVPAAGYKIEGLWISGLQRRLTIDNLLFPVKIISSIFNAKRILKKFKPDIAIGVGGYASWPLLAAASWLRIPTLIQEQNSYAGITNKYLSKDASKICVAYDNMNNFFPSEKVVITGNPVRKDILDISSKKEEALKYFNLSENKKTILVIGGSLGARTINESIEEGLERFAKSGVQVIWQTGKFYAEKAKLAATRYNDLIKAHEFISPMDLAYAAADIVISRAGALSISELCLVKKPAILVPSPNVAEDHQTKNAMALVKENAAILVTDKAAKVELVEKALNLLQDEPAQKKYAECIAKLGKPDSANEISRIAITIIEENRLKNKR